MSNQSKEVKLDKMKGPWGFLKTHMKRNALFFVSEPLDLITVATAFKEDQSRVVMAWMKSGHILRPDQETVSDWDPELELEFIIIQPFILVAFTIGEST